MSDLISRKEALELIDISFIIPILKMNLRPEHEAVLKIREIIMNMPTAFDKEKVIEELRSEASRWHESGVEFKDENEKGVAAGFRLATHIVEKGGIE